MKGSNIIYLYSATADREHNLIGQKLREYRKQKKIAPEEVLSRLASFGVDVTRSSLFRWEAGETIPNAYQLVAVARALGLEDYISCFSSAPLSAGLNMEGLEKLKDYRNDLVASGNYTPKPPVEDTIEYIDMPISCLAVSAGSGEFLSEGNFEMLSFPKSAVPAGADFGVRVNGDSMEPVYHNGQIVWVHETPDLQPGEEGIFVCDGCGYLKLFQLRDPAPEAVEDYLDSQGVLHKQPALISYNKAYDPILVSLDTDFKIVGKVL